MKKLLILAVVLLFAVALGAGILVFPLCAVFVMMHLVRLWKSRPVVPEVVPEEEQRDFQYMSRGEDSPSNIKLEIRKELPHGQRGEDQRT